MFAKGRKFGRETEAGDLEGGWRAWGRPSAKWLGALSAISSLAVLIGIVAIVLGIMALRTANDAEERLDGVEGIIASATEDVMAIRPQAGGGSNQAVSNDTASLATNQTEGEEGSPPEASGTMPGPDFNGTVDADGALALFESTLAVVVHGRDDDPFWHTVQQGAKDAAQFLGFHFFYDNPDSVDDEQALDQMEMDIRRARYGLFDGLIVSIPDSDRLRDAIAFAADEMPVLSINAGHEDFDDLGMFTHIGIPEFEAGQQAGEIMKDRGVKSAICVLHEDTVPFQQRCGGFELGLEGTVTNITLTREQSADDIQSAIEDALASNADLQGVLTLGPTGFAPAREALQGRICDPGTSPDTADCVAFGTFDTTPEVLDAIVQGELDFGMDQQEYLQGYLGVAFMFLKATYGVTPGAGAPVVTGPVVVDNREAAEILLQRNFTSGMTIGNKTARGLDIRYVVHGKPKDTFWKFVKAGVKLTARQHGLRIDYREPSQSADENEVRKFMVDSINEAVEDGVDGLVVTIPNDSPTLRNAIVAAGAAGIPVVSINGGDDRIREEEYGVVLHVGQGEEFSGRQVGKRLVRSGAARALCYIHDASDVTLKERCDGLQDGMQEVNPEAVVVPFESPANLTSRQMSASILDLLESDPDIDAVVALGKPASVPAVTAVEQLDMLCVAGRTPDGEGEDGCIAVVTFDFEFPVLDYIEEGKVLFGADEGPFLQGALPLVFLTLQNLWNSMPVGLVNTGPSFVDVTNVGLYEFFV
ncbi:unnamed protein product [Ostreobium quekettii]|uniref:Periplasmic binding protein domain-containing protein n=1 Tax=Ostreobium quekettii TaxID=121088 RepID=A0A8S1JAE5_9CHLO|nr:unnamed protein product [Ostreobium quekettii]